MRVIVAPSDVAPVEITHPVFSQFVQKADATAIAAARIAEVEEAARKTEQARLAALTANREVTQAMTKVRTTENLKRRLDDQLAAAERTITTARSTETKEEAGRTKEKVSARLAELETELTAARAELQAKQDAAAPLREAAAGAETARVAAV